MTSNHPTGPGFLARVVTVVLLVAPVLVVAYPFWPGHMSADSLVAYGQARDGQFTNQHSLLVNWLWSLVMPLGVGPGDLMIVTVAAFVVGCFLLLRQVLPMAAAALVAALIALSPMLLPMLGYVQRDGQFTACLMLGFGLLAASLQAVGWRRNALIAAALTAAWFLLALRQNALPAALVLVVFAVAALRPSRRWFVVVGAGVLVTLAMIASQAAIAKALPVKNVYPGAYIQVYDLGSLSKARGENLFPPSVMPERGMAPIKDHYNVDDVVGMVFLPDSPIQPKFLTDAQAEAVGRAWRSAVRVSPGDWLASRARIYFRLIGLTRDPMYPLHPQIDPNPFGLRIANPEANQKAMGYVRLFMVNQFDGGSIFSGWIYLVLCLLGVVVLLLRRRTLRTTAIGAAALAVVLYQAGLVVGTMTAGYRFMAPAVAVGLVVGVALVVLLMRPGRGQEGVASA